MKKKYNSIHFGFLLVLNLLVTQVVPAQQPFEVAEPDIALMLGGEGGSNGSAVAWNPKTRMYYTVVAGNADFSLDVFDADGNWLSGSAAGIDTRGLWYNPKKKALQGNGAGDIGYFSISLDENGNPRGEPQIYAAGEHQPEFQTVLSYDPSTGALAGFSGSTIYFYNLKNGKEAGVIDLQIGDEFAAEDFNTTSVGCTGLKNFEYVLLNYVTGDFVFFNMKGKQTGICHLDSEDAPATFKFTWCNDRLWIFNTSAWGWNSYRCF